MYAQMPPVPVELERFAVYVMGESPTGREALERATTIDAVIAGYDLPEARSLFKAMSIFLVGFATRGEGRLEEAEGYFERSIELARQANAGIDSSEGQRILADGYNQLLDIGGAGFKMFNVGRARRAADRAVELDPSNPLAHVAAAGFYINAPGIVGGDRARGSRHVEEARRLAVDSDYVLFLVAVWDARLAREEGDPDGAREAIARAHAIFPDNWWLAEVAGELGVGLPR